MNICPVCQRCYGDDVKFCLQRSHNRLVAARPGSREIVNGYRLNSLLEQDVVSETFEAVRLADNKVFVIRFISAKFQSETAERGEAFAAEARMLAAVRHPNIVGVHDSGVLENGEFYTVAQGVDGETLRRYQEEKKSFSESEAIAIVRQLAEALGAAHRAGVTHRALNPTNVIVTFDENNQPAAKIQNFDFGGVSERIVTADNLFDAPDADWRLEAFKYFSPEQCGGEQQSDYRSDIYSLGVVLYELLSGRPPFAAATVAALRARHTGEMPVPPENLRSDIKELLTHELMQILKKNPLARPQTTARFVSGLNQIEQAAAQPLSTLETLLPKTETAKPAVKSLKTTVVPPVSLSFKNILNGKLRKTEQPAELPVPTMENASLPKSQWFEAVLRSTEKNADKIVENDVVLVPENTEIALDKVADAPRPAQPAASLPSPLPEPETVLASAPVKIAEESAAISVEEVTAPATEPTARITAKLPKLLNFSDSEIEAMLDKAGTPDNFTNAPNTATVAAVLPTAPRRAGGSSYLGIGIAAVFVFALLGATALGAWFVYNSNIFGGETVAQQPLENGNQPQTTNEPPQPQTAPSNQTTETVTNQPAPQTPVPEPTPRGGKATAQTNNPAVKTQAELNSSLINWVAAAKSRDINKQVNFYAPKVETYYRTRNVTPETIRADKKRVFEGATEVDIQTAQTEINVAPDGRTATMRFRKKFAIKKGRKTEKGEVTQELQWVKTGASWKIVGERELKG